MRKVAIDIKTYWLKEDSVLATCLACNEVIYINQYVLTLDVNGVKKASDVRLCEPCMNLMKEIW